MNNQKNRPSSCKSFVGGLSGTFPPSEEVILCDFLIYFYVIIGNMT
jgi:hypothetical protein